MNTVLEDIRAAVVAGAVAVLLTTGMGWTFIASTSVAPVTGTMLADAGERLL